MDELNINLADGLTRGVLSKLVTKMLKKKLGMDSLTVCIKNVNGSLKDDELTARADVVLYVSKKELIDKVKEELL